MQTSGLDQAIAVASVNSIPRSRSANMVSLCGSGFDYRRGDQR
ncbi:MAG: hypothetical protein RLZZ598_1073 [Pseudomonadota bacterium]|jgi:hypothetical protein